MWGGGLMYWVYKGVVQSYSIICSFPFKPATTNPDLIMEAIIKAVKLVVETISKKIAKADEENNSNEVIHALSKAAACTSEAYTKLKRIALEVDYEDSEDEDIEDDGKDSEGSEDEDEDIEDDGKDSEGSEDEDIEDDGTDSEESEDEGGDLEAIDEDGEENEMPLQDIIKNLRVIVSYISKQVIEVGAEHLDDITAAGVDITTSITILDTLMEGVNGIVRKMKWEYH